MNSINKTLYLPLYGKSYVSKKDIILQDKTAESIWDANGFPLKRKSKSKWLAYYLGMRSAVFDAWTTRQLSLTPNSFVLHIGCGLDSRCIRVKQPRCAWYDIDFPEVINLRKLFYEPASNYFMLGIDTTEDSLFDILPKAENAVIIMEGISMYLSPKDLTALLKRFSHHFTNMRLLLDCYSSFAAKASKYKNPINEVGVTKVYGINHPNMLTKDTGLYFVKEHSITPVSMIQQLNRSEQLIFKSLYSGKIAKKMYRLYEFQNKI